MKTKCITTLLLASSLIALPALAEPTPTAGQIDFGSISAPADGQFVEVNIRANLISMAAKLAEKSEPEVARLLRGLKSVRVNVVSLNDDNREEITERIQSVRRQLTKDGWERIVTVKENNEDIGVFVKTRGEEAVEGVVVTVIDGGKEAVFVNVVGDIQPEQIAKVGESLNIDPLKKLSHNFQGTDQ